MFKNKIFVSVSQNTETGQVDLNIGDEHHTIISGVDDVPTEYSDNFAKSGGIKSELEKKLSKKLDGDTFYVTDALGYVIAKIDATGVHSVNIDEEPNVIHNDRLFITDANNFIIASIDSTGVHAPNIDGKTSNVINDERIVITDNNDNIIAQIDKNGVHSAKDKYAVCCMVLSDNYYPTSTPTRDSEGNVTNATVMFETGVSGTIEISYTNGLASSVEVTYGNNTYTITINRDSEGNVNNVSIN